MATVTEPVILDSTGQDIADGINAIATTLSDLSNDKVESQSIAPVVTNPTTVAISSGSHFMLDGIRYRATTTISAGGNITPNTNCVAESVEDSLNQSVTYETTRFYIAKPKNMNSLETVFQLPKRPKTASVSNLKYFNGSSWTDLNTPSVSIIDNGLDIGTTAPSGVVEGAIYWGQATITVTY